ncbi:MAG: quinolinate synthase NadA [Bacteroidales bacterium]|jgi:quinolinate synthase|nr:quinolinate synthase NadA [Bacteroidales bacterium]MDD2570315.1 quinolinate synthase NadA [Bacteroidales bacterium]MDD2812656.1 quinolinate synthase NadA [Bacteroidales bacterium]MDD3811216.1 quinolinate synthase NadA [Bacteroidales bacterium]MDD3870420.1 quinolinate synthase NadA [Bacteroidales bacterium]
MKESWIKKGFVDEPIASNLNLVEEIKKLAREKNAVILAHYYQQSDIQDIADIIGDSLDLSRKAAETQADIILFAGVHFMAETAKILAPEKKVLIPDQNAGCSLADSCPPDLFEEFLQQHPDHLVVTYVNTSAAIKALSDICCTSTNALSIIKQIPEDQKIIFAPDRNLGNYINSMTGRDMLVWDGACHVHEEFSLEKILELKNEYPEAKIIAHPECQKPILIVSDFVGSTSALLRFASQDAATSYIVATESGILHQMRKASPAKTFIPAPPKDSTCACNDCSFMKLHTLKKIYLTLLHEWPEVTVEEDIRIRAEKPIRRMLEMS